MSKEHAQRTRDLVEAADRVMFSSQKWRTNPTTENHISYLAAKVEYLEAVATLEEFLREKLEERMKALEGPLPINQETAASFPQRLSRLAKSKRAKRR